MFEVLTGRVMKIDPQTTAILEEATFGHVVTSLETFSMQT